jgi:hypothetical protein
MLSIAELQIGMGDVIAVHGAPGGDCFRSVFASVNPILQVQGHPSNVDFGPKMHCINVLQCCRRTPLDVWRMPQKKCGNKLHII